MQQVDDPLDMPAAHGPRVVWDSYFGQLCALVTLVTAVKLLLLPAYHSTDFDVHRNWMAITSTLPRSQWYVDATSEWTLDYPPLFAWFERVLGVGARMVEPAMLTVSAKPYASAAAVAYQRGTVMASDALLLYGAHRFVRAHASDSFAPILLSFCNAGLLLVDHIHFQYNGMLIGVLLLSIAEIRGA